MKALVILGVLLCFPPANAKTAPSLSPAPTSRTPAPAPAPNYVNLTNLLTVARSFHKFLSYLISTKVIDTFQSQANNTEEGITIFVPKDRAFSSQKNPSLANLTQDQLKSLILFHGIPHYYTLADVAGLSRSSPVTAFAGGGYSINFMDDSGAVHLSSGWTHTKISSSVHSTDPMAVYQIGKVLLPPGGYLRFRHTPYSRTRPSSRYQSSRRRSLGNYRGGIDGIFLEERRLAQTHNPCATD